LRNCSDPKKAQSHGPNFPKIQTGVIGERTGTAPGGFMPFKIQALYF
jgi:hypothetical protein